MWLIHSFIHSFKSDVTISSLRLQSYNETGLRPASVLVLVLYFWFWFWSYNFDLSLALGLALGLNILVLFPSLTTSSNTEEEEDLDEWNSNSLLFDSAAETLTNSREELMWQHKHQNVTITARLYKVWYSHLQQESRKSSQSVNPCKGLVQPPATRIKKELSICQSLQRFGTASYNIHSWWRFLVSYELKVKRYRYYSC